MRAENVIDVSNDMQEIIEAIQTQINKGRLSSSHIYFKEGTSRRISELLADIKLYTQKKFYN